MTAPSPTPLKEGQSFPVLKWQSYSGYFKDFDLKSDIDKGARAVLDYKPTELKVFFSLSLFFFLVPFLRFTPFFFFFLIVYDGSRL